MKIRLGLAAVVAAGVVAAAANAEFFPGQFVSINGFAGPEFGGTTFGTNAGQGQHQLGGASNYFDSVFGPGLPVFVTSTVVNPFSVVFSFDFSGFFPGDFTSVSFDIIGLKQDGSIIGVEGNLPGFGTDGSVVTWSGSGDDLAAVGTLSFKVSQVPGPGALALLGLAGMTGVRRRRA